MLRLALLLTLLATLALADVNGPARVIDGDRIEVAVPPPTRSGPLAVSGSPEAAHPPRSTPSSAPKTASSFSAAGRFRGRQYRLVYFPCKRRPRSANGEATGETGNETTHAARHSPRVPSLHGDLGRNVLVRPPLQVHRRRDAVDQGDPENG